MFFVQHSQQALALSLSKGELMILKDKHYEDHKLVSRRDFLAHGVIPFSAWLAFPGLFGMGLRKAYAAECGGAVGSSMVPFMVFDMAGGAALPANFLVGGKGGPEDLLPSYNQLGWDPRESGSLNKEFGLPMSARYSGLLAGILANTSTEARANFRMGSICHQAQSDNSSNKLNSASLALRAGSRGTYVTNGLSVRNRVSGGKSAAVFESNALKPTFIDGMDALLGATNVGGDSFTGIELDKLKEMVKNGVDLSQLQTQDYLGQPGGEAIGDLSQCAYEKSVEFVEGVSGLDPRENNFAQQVYGINAGTAQNDTRAITAALAMNTINGASGPSVFTLGDCDYHNGTSTKGDGKDREMGDEIGRAIELAHRMNKPFFFHLLTDGGCSSNSRDRVWTGDQDDYCMSVLGYYSPDGPPKMKTLQVGHFNTGQGAARDTLLGNSPTLVGYAVFANYLNICGKLKEFHNYAPGVFTKKSQLESVLVFEGKA